MCESNIRSFLSENFQYWEADFVLKNAGVIFPWHRSQTIEHRFKKKVLVIPKSTKYLRVTTSLYIFRESKEWVWPAWIWTRNFDRFRGRSGLKSVMKVAFHSVQNCAVLPGRLLALTFNRRQLQSRSYSMISQSSVVPTFCILLFNLVR